MLRFIIVTFVGLAALPLIIGMFLSSAWKIEAVREVDAPAAQIYPNILDLNQWTEWAITTEQKEADPNAEWSFEGTPGEVGATLVYTSSQLGSNRITLTAVSERAVEYEMRNAQRTLLSQGRVSVEPQPTGGSRLAWSVWGEYDGFGPIGGYFALLAKLRGSGYLEDSLTRLAKISSR